MKIEFIKNFIKLNKFKNFSKLAKNLEISQSTLSHQISQIEKQLGDIKLIERTTRSFRLTEEGEIFLGFAEKIIDLYDSCIYEIKRHKEDKTEEVVIKITASTLPGSHIIPKFITDFKSKNPTVNFKIMINNSLKSINKLIEADVDFAAIGSFMDKEQDMFDSIKIGEENLVFMCSPNHDLLVDGNGTVDLSNLLKYPFINREEGSGTRNIVIQQFDRYDELNMNLEINDNDSIISAVSGSNNIAILSEIIAKKARDAGLIEILQIEGYPIIAKRDIYLIKKKGQELSEMKQQFWNYLKS